MAADTSLRERRRALLARTDLQGDAFCAAYSAEADDWLSGVATRAVGETNRHLALLAVGGYGRGSLCPYSDLDVVLVHKGHRDIKAVADAIWYPVWDEGVHLDHSVRRPSEVLSAAADDVRVALGLLDARLVWGDAKVADPLIVDARTAWRESLGTRFLPDLEGQMRDRHRGVGDVAFLLEPDLKESHGGLRDVNVLRAISAYAPLLADYADLASLEPATALLTRVRVELHRNAGREQDRLLLQDQDQIAAALDFEDADVLMAAVSAAGRQIAWVSDDVWRRRRLWDPTPPPKTRQRRLFRGDHPATPSGPVPVGPDMVDIGGEIALLPERARLGGRLPRLPPRRHGGRARPAHRQRVPAPAGRPHAATGRPVAPRRSWRRSCASWPPDARPSTSSSHSTSTGCWCGSSPSGPPSATSRSATPITPIRSTGTCWKRQHWRPG